MSVWTLEAAALFKLLNRQFGVVCNTNRFYSSQLRSFREVNIPVPWGHVAGKWWAPYETRPVLALHGWQDTCGTYNRLAPLLTDKVGLLTIDLPGHGLSSRLPPGMSYLLINYCILIKQIMQFFEWKNVSLMGHSMGSIVNYIYTALFPNDVDFLVCIDGMLPLFSGNFAQTIAEGIDSLLKYDVLAQSEQEPPCYPLEALEKKWGESLSNSIELQHTHHIISRTIAPSKSDPTKYYFTRDPRIKSLITVGSSHWCKADLVESAERVTTPILIIKFEGSGYFANKELFYEVLDIIKKSSKDAQFRIVEGSHHAHLNNPERVNEIINNFILKHNVENRSHAGLRDDILV